MSRLSPRAAILMTFFAFGASIGAWAGSIPSVTRAAGVGDYGLGLGLTLLTVTSIAGMAVSGRVGRRWSNRSVLLVVLPAMALAAGLTLISASPVALFAALFLFGACIGLHDVFMNAEAGAIEADLARPVYARFHAAVSLAMAVFALLASMTTTLVGAWATALIVLPVAGLAWMMVWRAVPHRRPSGGASARIPPDRRGRLVLLGLISGLIVVAETSSLFWSARLLDGLAPQLAAIAGLGVAFFSGCNALMRYFGDALRARYGDQTLLRSMILLPIAGFLVLGLQPGFALSTLAFGATGIGLSLLSPILFLMAALQVPGNRAAGLGFMFVVAGPTRIAAPWAFGWVAEGWSPSIAFGLCAVLLALALGLILLLPRLVPANG
jgi:MFS family permease